MQTITYWRFVRMLHLRRAAGLTAILVGEIDCKKLKAALAHPLNSKSRYVWRIAVLRNDQYVHRLLRALILCWYLHDLL